MEISGRLGSGQKRIGELLVAANVIRQEVLMEALKVAKNSQTPVGRVLMTIGELSERDVESAIYVQSLIRNGSISEDFGIKAINVSVKGKLPLEEAFRRLGWSDPSLEEQEKHSSGEIGELLLQAGLVTREVLEQAHYQSQENNLPLGRCLVLSRALSPALLQSVLTAQVLIRDGKITIDQAIVGLKKSSLKTQSLEQSLSDTGAYKLAEMRNIKFGDLLTQAGIVTEGDKISAMEVGLAENKKMGEVLVQNGMIAPTVVDESLKLQELVSSGEISGIQAADILRQSHARRVSIDVIMGERVGRQQEVERVNGVFELLVGSGALSGDNFNKAQNLARQASVSIAEIIVAKDMIDKRIINAACQGQKLMQEGLLKQPQCVSALKLVISTGKEFHEVLKEVHSTESSADASRSAKNTATVSGGDDGKKSGWLGKLFGSK